MELKCTLEGLNMHQSKSFWELFHYFLNVFKWLVGLLAVRPSSYLPKQHLEVFKTQQSCNLCDCHPHVR